MPVPSSVIRYSRTLPVYDQGDTPRCVAYSGALASTIDQRRDMSRTVLYDADEAYARCKEADGIPNEDGTYPRVLLKIKKDRGMRRKATAAERFDKIEAYARLTSLQDIKVAIFLWGSVQLGSDWYEEWFNPATPILPPGVTVAGGHAYDAVGYSDRKQALLLQNSWGRNWAYTIGGVPGRVWLPYSYLNLADEVAWEAWRAVDARDSRR